MNYLDFLREVKQEYDKECKEYRNGYLCNCARRVIGSLRYPMSFLPRFKGEVLEFGHIESTNSVEALLDPQFVRFVQLADGDYALPGFNLACHNYRMRILTLMRVREERRMKRELP